MVKLEKIISNCLTVALAQYEVVCDATSTERNDGNGNGCDNSSRGDVGRPQRACNYKDFRKCKPKSFCRSEDIIGLTRWRKKMESVFQINFCLDNIKV